MQTEQNKHTVRAPAHACLFVVGIRFFFLCHCSGVRGMSSSGTSGPKIHSEVSGLPHDKPWPELPMPTTGHLTLQIAEEEPQHRTATRPTARGDPQRMQTAHKEPSSKGGRQRRTPACIECTGAPPGPNARWTKRERPSRGRTLAANATRRTTLRGRLRARANLRGRRGGPGSRRRTPGSQHAVPFGRAVPE